tara:strand:- start:943 stop:1110 length:168 start_codon:yes stop_codon:yes gene_type:complete
MVASMLDRFLYHSDAVVAYSLMVNLYTTEIGLFVRTKTDAKEMLLASKIRIIRKF